MVNFYWMAVWFIADSEFHPLGLAQPGAIILRFILTDPRGSCHATFDA